MSELTYQIGVLQASDTSKPEGWLAAEHAFTHLDNEYRARLISSSRNYLGSAALVEEVVQEVMISAWLHKDELSCQSQSKNTSYLLKALQWRTLNTQRDTSRQVQNTSFDEIGEGEHFISISAANMVSTVEGFMDLQEIANAMDRLKKDYKDVLAQTMGGMDINELAEYFGISAGAAKTKRSRARKALNKVLQDWQDDPSKTIVDDQVDKEPEQTSIPEGKRFLLQYYKDDIRQDYNGIKKAQLAWQKVWGVGLDKGSGHAPAMRILTAHILMQSAVACPTLQELTSQTGYFNNFASEVLDIMEEHGLAVRLMPLRPSKGTAQHIISPTSLLITEAFHNPGIQKQIERINQPNSDQ